MILDLTKVQVSVTVKRIDTELGACFLEFCRQ